ncbi:unnamed protein product [Menidia menidia]|uniref:(Atlantic silverside) hypothetical protein n=1 Tax=Menidia menidia TaxID=238744 RepID=A0A8S4AJ10_9TELE|nr:unnamed protein product [Menidia menidia]
MQGRSAAQIKGWHRRHDPARGLDSTLWMLGLKSVSCCPLGVMSVQISSNKGNLRSLCTTGLNLLDQNSQLL